MHIVKDVVAMNATVLPVSTETDGNVMDPVIEKCLVHCIGIGTDAARLNLWCLWRQIYPWLYPCGVSVFFSHTGLAGCVHGGLDSPDLPPRTGHQA